MNKNQRFSILTFPQHYDGNVLRLNIVVLPRDQNPLAPAIEPALATDPTASFVEANLSFRACIFDGLQTSPHINTTITEQLTVQNPANAKKIFMSLANLFKINNLKTSNSNYALIDNADQKYKPADARPAELTVKKYLPKSYRNSFNFTTPRHRNAVTDDSYHCAIKEAVYDPNFTRSSDKVSWGKVFAYLIRQPLLAEQTKMLYRTEFAITGDLFKKGGWLFVDLADDSDFRVELDADYTFIRRYAARIPPLEKTKPRQLFSALQFPVLKSASNSLNANYDQLFIEAAEYDDGFAKIIHCQQPPNRDLLLEDNDGAHPVKDVGIRLGWDDEQLLIWYIRQMEENPSGELHKRLDAPLGVFGYNVDVRESAEPENPWESLNAVTSKNNLTLPPPPPGRRPINLGGFAGEIGYQVYPVQVDGDKTKNFWLPMYFAGWNGHSMILPDQNGADIYQTTNKKVTPDPIDTTTNTGTGVSGPAQNQLNKIYKSSTINTELRYGKNYDFRVRLQDLSGGSPNVQDSPINKSGSDVASCRFRRYISPNQPRIQEMNPSPGGNGTLINSDSSENLAELNIQRPKLGYPAVVYTGKYSDPIQRLIKQAKLGLQYDKNNPYKDSEHRVGLGIGDPDVDRLEIVVEIATLSLDKLDSISGKDDFVHLYTTYREFPEVNDDNDYEAVLTLPIEYRDVKVLRTGSEVDLVDDFNLEDTIDNLPMIILPTGRTIRLSIRAVCEEKTNNKHYYGLLSNSNKKLDNRFGEPVHISLYSPSVDETALLQKVPQVPTLQGIYMQPDLVTVHDGRLATTLFGSQAKKQHSNIHRLAEQLQLECHGLSLSASKGERVVFGCSSRIRHTLAPDGSSITFASKGDLINHWLCCISYDLNRDWMWDGLEYRSFVIRRTKKFTEDDAPLEENVIAGDIEIVRTASFESLHNPNRNRTRIVFIDAVEPKKEDNGNSSNKLFPDTIELNYTLETNIKADHGQQHDPPEKLQLKLPITTPPAQVPKIVSAGIALSPYVRNSTYSKSEPRDRHLWIEFEEPLIDPQDCYFARLLAVAPDQLISNNNPELLEAPEEPELPIDPEYIRTITTDSSNDLAGLQGMQVMEKSRTSDRHYLLPLPPGLHANSDEMFGFFTYEFRVGHFREPTEDNPEMVWTTAQGRFGRRLRVTGIQHPAPTLVCFPKRDQDKLWVTAPYAVAVHEGKNVTADPPRTELWALLYAQVKQADNRDFRNILLDDRQLDWRVQVEPQKDVRLAEEYDDEQRQLLRSIVYKNLKYNMSGSPRISGLKLKSYSSQNRDATKYGTTVWLNSEVSHLLTTYGLPLNSPLSVVVVETLPQITNIFEHVSGLKNSGVAKATSNLMGVEQQQKFWKEYDEKVNMSNLAVTPEKPSPVSDQLGHHRLLRTSPLTEVPAICVKV